MGSVVVIGGGVVGLCTAHALRTAGFDVRVLEAHRVGSGASTANAGIISPLVAVPVAAPGVLDQTVRSVVRREGAIGVRPGAVLPLAPFFLRFVARSNARDARTAARALRALAVRSLELFERMVDDGVPIALHRRDYLGVYTDPDRAAHRLAEQRGAPGGASLSAAVLRSDELRALEPAFGPRAQAGFVAEAQPHVDSEQVCQALAEHLRGQGVEIVTGARVSAAEPTSGGVRVRSSRGTFTAAKAVVAAGVHSRHLAAALGLTLPVHAGKGYSFRVPTRGGHEFRHVVRIEEAKVVAVPTDGGVRIAGTMEFDHRPERFDHRRVEAIVRVTRPYLPGLDWAARSHEWMGARPMTPDSLPLIGPVPTAPDVVVATGHNMLGVMLAPATGERVARILTGADDGRGPFRVDRFHHAATPRRADAARR